MLSGSNLTSECEVRHNGLYKNGMEVLRNECQDIGTSQAQSDVEPDVVAVVVVVRARVWAKQPQGASWLRRLPDQVKLRSVQQSL